jgi:MFS transporter, BCD family, chlorophyll transporter
MSATGRQGEGRPTGGLEAKTRRKPAMVAAFQNLGPRWLPFADAASPDLPLGRLLRLSLFQVSVAIALVLLNGTLNRVMIVELGVPVSFVAAVIAIPVLAAPFRLLIGHRSDNYSSLIGWRRMPYAWLGTMLQFGGLAIMPFAMLLLQSQTLGPQWVGPVGAMAAFLLTGFGMHMTQTAGLALATDLAAEDSRPRVVALMYVVMLAGMIAASLIFSRLLDHYSPLGLVRVVQGAALATLIINLAAFWKQEPQNKAASHPDRQKASLAFALSSWQTDADFKRLVLTVALGSAAFSMQDVLLEPYGGQVLGLSVSSTTQLTALWAAAAIAGFALAGRQLLRGADMHAMAGFGMLAGVAGLAALVFAAPLQSPGVLRAGTLLIGFGGGLFSVGTMLAAMRMGARSGNGIAIGAWGAAQATAAGIGIAAGGFIRDAANQAAATLPGLPLDAPSAGYLLVYHIEIMLLFAGMIAIGPLVGRDRIFNPAHPARFGIAELPG